MAFEDKNITLEKFKHHLKISLNVEYTEFKIHAIREEKIVGSSQTIASQDTSAFTDDQDSNEIVKIYVSFYNKNNEAKTTEYLQAMRRQVKDGKIKLNLINPFFLGINYGKISINDEEYTKNSLDKCDLIFREGIYLKSTYLLCSIYKFTNYITNEIYIKILAFDNQRGLEYAIDLDYTDLLEMTDSNVNLLNNHKDLANYLTNSLAYFRNSQNEEILV